MPQHWTCDTCGQRIARAQDGWVSWSARNNGANVRLVHHLSASPWAHWGGCYAADEEGSLHLLDALGAGGAVSLFEEVAWLDEAGRRALEAFFLRLSVDTAKNVDRARRAM
jgi:hypothetical protein